MRIFIAVKDSHRTEIICILTRLLTVNYVDAWEGKGSSFLLNNHTIQDFYTLFSAMSSLQLKLL